MCYSKYGLHAHRRDPKVLFDQDPSSPPEAGDPGRRDEFADVLGGHRRVCLWATRIGRRACRKQPRALGRPATPSPDQHDDDVLGCFPDVSDLNHFDDVDHDTHDDDDGSYHDDDFGSYHDDDVRAIVAIVGGRSHHFRCVAK